MKITKEMKIKELRDRLEIKEVECRLLRVELETIKKYTLTPIVSLQIALEKTVDCVAHVLTDMRVIKGR